MKRKFQDDFNLKINMSDPDDFYYFVDLYNVRNELDILLNMIEKYGEAQYLEKYENTKM